MNFDLYSSKANETVEYPKIGENLVYPAMGLSGEAGEFCDKVKKLWRNRGTDLLNGYNVSPEEQMALIKELGDVLWYINACAMELHVSLSYVAQINIEKLADRKQRNVIRSQGDFR